MKLWIHQKSFSEEELIINAKEFPGIQVGDILEIYHADENNSHLLLQVKTLKEAELPQKDIISVGQTIATLFQLRAYKDVVVTPVSKVQDIGLDLVELVFKDQYISRSDMWRLKNSLVRSCLHIQQKTEFSGIRAQVSELWARGEKVMCGAVTEDTRVAFRSSTAMVYLFIQMSSEMWDFDTCGDLYIEKAVNGFLTEFFSRWKRGNINSELTLVLFSRTIYEAKSIDEFPVSMQSTLHVDCSGRIYEDFYRVIVHNERRDDWMPMLTSLKKIMWEYNRTIGSSHVKDGSILRGYNSKAANGNILEAMNMSLNVFDNHYINRNFDRTGQVVEIVTPGAGVFHVDRTLCEITKHRMIDYGIGSDLVCLAEQPPHPVPLLLFDDERARTPGSTETHHIPYWLNYSFYLSPSQRQKNFSSARSHFTPRMRLPTSKAQGPSTDPKTLPKLPSQTRNGMQYSELHLNNSNAQDDLDQFILADQTIFKVQNSKVKRSNNPFSPASLTTKLIADRRRWTHTFPHGPQGDVIQLHHRQSSTSLMESSGTSLSELSTSSSASSLCNESSPEEVTADESPSKTSGILVNLKRRIGCGWGITGEQAWTPFLQTGVDWKSLTATACFPITTDFYPDKKTLEMDFLESPHTLDILPDDRDEMFSPSGKTIQSVFEELISQRLIQNYQLVVLPRSELARLAQKGSSSQPLVSNPNKHEYVLSYGQTYHKISLKPDLKSVEIVRYNARQQRISPKLSYSYQLWPIRKTCYEHAHTRIYHKPVDNKWNHRDNYICLGGAATREGFDLQESLKFWKSRFVLLPSSSSLIRKLSDSGYQGNLDVFEARRESQMLSLLDGFLRFVEGINRKRKAPSRPQSKRPSVAGDFSQSTTPRRLPSRPSNSGENTPTTLQPNFGLSTANITKALASINISERGGPKGKEEGGAGGLLKSSPNSPEPERLTLMSSPANIVAVMRTPFDGVKTVPSDTKGMPGDCFVSAEAVAWIRKNFLGNVGHNEAVKLMQGILEEGLIRSVFSAAANQTFFYGYYIYCFVPQSEVNSPDVRKLAGFRDLRTASSLTYEPSSSQLLEVTCWHPEGGNCERHFEQSEVTSELGVESITKLNLPVDEGGKGDGNVEMKQPAYKSLFLEIDSTKLKDRLEWCHVGYHSNYNPQRAFEIELQWLTSTPSLLNELITNWSRRAATNGYHLVPSHVDPFGFNADTADSLHSPLFIELRLPEEYLGLGSQAVVEGSLAMERIHRVQQLITSRFGFLDNQTSCYSPLASNTQSGHSSLPIHNQYIHVTGCAFLLSLPFCQKPSTPRSESLPCLCRLGCISETNGSAACSRNTHGLQSSGSWFKSPVLENYGQKSGFLYIHNYLLTKKWRSAATGDDRFHEALLTDLSKFCRGEDGRLRDILSKTGLLETEKSENRHSANLS